MGAVRQEISHPKLGGGGHTSPALQVPNTTCLPKLYHVAATAGSLCCGGAIPGLWVGASAGSAHRKSQLQGPSVLWQPACPLPLFDLAGPALLASGHQDHSQHEKGHKGEEVLHTLFPQHHDWLSHLLQRPCSMPCIQRWIVLENSDGWGEHSLVPDPAVILYFSLPHST